MTPQDSPAPGQAQPVPDHYGSLTPYVSVRGASAFLDFVQQAFGAVERGRFTLEDGTIGHAEVWIGNRVLMAFDARPEWPDIPALLSLYVDDCDAVHAQALTAGATELTPLATTAFGDRGSRVRDPFGNIWWIQTHVEDVDDGEMVRRLSEPAYIDVMRRAQQTLDDELRRRASEDPGR
jgi:PhnB protein